MLLIISPSKTQKIEGRTLPHYTQPVLLARSWQLVDQLSPLSRTELAELMKMSAKLADLTFDRYQAFTLPFTLENVRQALLLFRGDQFSSLEIDNYTAEDFLFVQDHLRILSGLYGVLRPLDLIQPYRLEMATKNVGEQGNTLYGFWQDLLIDQLRVDLSSQRNPVLVNLASDEYFKALQPDDLGCSVLKVSFKEIINNKPRTIAIHAKRARGMMVHFVIRNRLTEVEKLKDFSLAGYRYADELSSNKEWVFNRLRK